MHTTIELRKGSNYTYKKEDKLLARVFEQAAVHRVSSTLVQTDRTSHNKRTTDKTDHACRVQSGTSLTNNYNFRTKTFEGGSAPGNSKD